MFLPPFREERTVSICQWSDDANRQVYYGQSSIRLTQFFEGFYHTLVNLMLVRRSPPHPQVSSNMSSLRSRRCQVTRRRYLAADSCRRLWIEQTPDCCRHCTRFRHHRKYAPKALHHMWPPPSATHVTRKGHDTIGHDRRSTERVRLCPFHPINLPYVFFYPSRHSSLPPQQSSSCRKSRQAASNPSERRARPIPSRRCNDRDQEADAEARPKSS